MRSLKLVDDGLQPEQFIIPARNARGETERQWFRCSPELDRAIAEIVHSRKFPFRTPGDCIRFCVHHGVKWLEKQGGVKTNLQQAEAIHALLLAEDQQQQFSENIQLARGVIDRLVRENDHVEARRIVLELKARVAEMAPGHWRKKYRKAIDDQFGHLLTGKGAPPVKLLHTRPAEEDDE